MKLRLVNVWSVLGLMLSAALLLSGCASTSEPIFTTNPILDTGTNSGGQPRSIEDAVTFHVGDPIIVTFSDVQDPPLPHEERIKEDGNITLPLSVVVKAVGKSPGELQKEIHDRYVPKYYVRLTVTVKTGVDLAYYVMGEVRGPGPKPYTGVTTVTKAIAAAGGLTDFASKNLVLIRANGTKIKVSYRKAIQDPKADLQIFPGDSINVEKSW